MISLRFVEGVYKGTIIGMESQLSLNAIGIALTTLRHFGTCGALWAISPNIETFFCVQLIVAAISLASHRVLLFRVVPRTAERISFAFTHLSRVRKFASGMLLYSGLSLLLTQIDKLILVSMVRLDEFGIYVFATSITTVLNSLLAPILQAVYPRMVSAFASSEVKNFAHIYHMSAQTVSSIVGTIGIVMFFNVETFIYFWTGNHELIGHSATLTRLMLVGSIINCISHVPYYCQLAHGWTSLSVMLHAGAVVIVVPAMFIVVPAYGVVGCAWIWIVWQIGNLVFTSVFMHFRIVKSELKAWLFYDNLLPLCVALLVVFLCWDLFSSSCHTRLQCGLYLAFSLALGSTGALLVAAQLRGAIYDEVKRLMVCR